MKKVFFFISLLTINFYSYSQIGIGTKTPNQSALIDFVSPDKGVLFPRVALTSANSASPITSPANGLVIFNTATSGVGINSVVANNLYVWDTNRWEPLKDGNGIYSGNGSISIPTTVTQNTNTLAFTSTVNNAFSIDGTTFSVDASNNRVGIGTSTPNTPLTIVAEGTNSFISDFYGAVSTVASGSNNKNISLVGYRNTFASKQAMQNNDKLFIGFRGLYSPTQETAMRSAISSIALSDFTTNTPSMGLSFYTSASGGPMSEKVRLNEIGNLGISTTSPTEKLDVVGNIKLSGALIADNSAGTSGQVLTSNGTIASWTNLPNDNNGIYSGDGSILVPTTVTQNANRLAFTSTVTNAFSVDGTTFSVDASNNRIGIGTATPTKELEVIGEIKGTRIISYGAGNIALNTAIGDGSLLINTTGSGNTATGYRTLYSNTIGISNTAFGTAALYSNTDGDNNTAAGYNTLYYNTTGSSNTAIGKDAIISNTTGDNNTAAGFSALKANTTGSKNIGIGINSFIANTASSNNISIGANSAKDYNLTTTTEANNIFIGSDTGWGITTGTNNTILGSKVQGLASTLSNNIIIADGAGNRRINVDATGNVGIGTITPSQKLHVLGNIFASGTITPSDARFKINIETVKNPLEIIGNIRGTSYLMNTKQFPEKGFSQGKQFGVIAQEVEKIIPELVTNGNDGYKAVNYQGFIPILIEAVKSQQTQIEKHKEELTTKESEIKDLKNRVENLEKAVKNLLNK